MRGVVGEVEAAFERIRCIGRILEPREPRTFQALELLGIRRFRRKWLAGTGQTLKRGGHARHL